MDRAEEEGVKILRFAPRAEEQSPGSRGAEEQSPGSRGAEEQRSRGGESREQRSRGAEEQRSRGAESREQSSGSRWMKDGGSTEQVRKADPQRHTHTIHAVSSMAVYLKTFFWRYYKWLKYIKYLYCRMHVSFNVYTWCFTAAAIWAIFFVKDLLKRLKHLFKWNH